uniref:Transcription factor CBF/NF-Y/archaeal histone domain-containing protein n=1 Tax=Panagrolaimus sp. JU765 TaxID=591449 RepID=A0AC34QFT6_9BILA
MAAGQSSSSELNCELAIKKLWDERNEKIENMTQKDFRELTKHLELPLARIKKIMKIDDNARSQMISSEAPVILSVAAEYLIEEMTMRAFLHTEQNRRKTIQKSDVAMAISGVELFDFLIDIIPRDEIKTRSDQKSNDSKTENGTSGQVQYLYAGDDSSGVQLVQLPDGQVMQATQIGPSIPLSAAPGQPIQVMTVDGNEQFQIVPVPALPNSTSQN